MSFLLLMYGKEASSRKREIDCQHYTILNQRSQRPKDKHYGNVYNRLWNPSINLFRQILVSRNEEKLKKQQNNLQSQYHVAVKYIVCELTQSNAVDLIFERLNNWQVPVDFLVNNAGFNECGLFTNTDTNQEMKMIERQI